MKKCPSCGRSYSDMVQVCPACNIALGESAPGPKPAAEEWPREERKETVVREERVVQKKPKQKSTKNTTPAPASKGPVALLGVMGLIILACIVFYMNSQTKAKQAAVERSNPTVQATEEKNLSADSTSASENTAASVTINGSIQYAEMMGEPEIQNGKIVANYEGEDFYYCAVIQADVVPGEYSLDENNGLEVCSKNGGDGELFSEGCTVEDGYFLQIDMRANFKTGQTFISGTFRLNSEESQSKISTFSFSVAVPTSELLQNENNAEDENSTEPAAEGQRTEATAAAGDDGQLEEATGTEPETQMPVSVSPDTAVMRIDGEEYTFYLDKTSTEAVGNNCYGVYKCKGANGYDRYELMICFHKEIQPGTFSPFWDGVQVIIIDLKSNTKYSLDLEPTFTITEADSEHATYAGRLYGEMRTKNKSGELSYAFTIESCEFRFTVYKFI